MNNLERMKKDIIAQIEAMDADTFRSAVESLTGKYGVSNDLAMDFSQQFLCEACAKEYGECREEENCCSERFRKFAASEC